MILVVESLHSVEWMTHGSIGIVTFLGMSSVVGVVSLIRYLEVRSVTLP